MPDQTLTQTHDQKHWDVQAPYSRTNISTLEMPDQTLTQTHEQKHWDIQAPIAIHKNPTLNHITYNLNRNNPLASVETNKSDVKQQDFINRNYRLAQRIQPGAFENQGHFPQQQRLHLNPTLNNSKRNLESKAMRQM